MTMVVVTHEMGFARTAAEPGGLHGPTAASSRRRTPETVLHQPAERARQGLPVQDPQPLTSAGPTTMRQVPHRCDDASRSVRQESRSIAACSPSRSPSRSRPAAVTTSDDGATRASSPTTPSSRPARRWRKLNEAGKITVGVKFDQPGFGAQEPGRGRARGLRRRDRPRSIAAELGHRGRRHQVGRDRLREPGAVPGQRHRRHRGRDLLDHRRAPSRWSVGGPYYVDRPAAPGREGRRLDQRAGRPGRQEGLLGRGLDVDRRPSRRSTAPQPRALRRPTRECVEQLLAGPVDAVTTDDAILLGYAAPRTRTSSRSSASRSARSPTASASRRATPRCASSSTRRSRGASRTGAGRTRSTRRSARPASRRREPPTVDRVAEALTGRHCRTSATCQTTSSTTSTDRSSTASS